MAKHVRHGTDVHRNANKYLTVDGIPSRAVYSQRRKAGHPNGAGALPMAKAMVNQQTDPGEVSVLTCGDASALHARDAEGLNLVSIGNLRVIVKNDGGHWSAQGLEIDYAVDGTSFDDVTNEFARGLMLTIDENLHVFGHIKNVLKTAPAEIWDEFFQDVMADKLELSHSQISIHKIPAHVYVAKAA